MNKKQMNEKSRRTPTIILNTTYERQKQIHKKTKTVKKQNG